MALAQDIANKSIREALQTLAEAVDKVQVAPSQDLSALTRSIEDLRSAVKALDLAINGEAPVVPSIPAPTPEPTPTPVVPV